MQMSGSKHSPQGHSLVTLSSAKGSWPACFRFAYLLRFNANASLVNMANNSRGSRYFRKPPESMLQNKQPRAMLMPWPAVEEGRVKPVDCFFGVNSNDII